MTSTIKVNTVTTESGSTLTLGESGKTVTLASGASQSGFGRSGSVNWQTTPKTTNFTAADGEGYFINSGSALTANLPAGSAGAIVAFSDYARNFATHNFTIVPNGSEKIGGNAANLKLTVDGQALTLVYVDSTKGWINVQNAEDTEQGVTFIAATGGAVTTSGDFKIHTFTGPGTFCVSAVGTPGISSAVDYLVVGAGGGGGFCMGGGGGAGGYRESPGSTTGCYARSPLGVAPAAAIPLSVQAYPIAVGGGGGGGTSCHDRGCSGAVSTFSTITSAGGGGGGARPTASPNNTLGLAGGSGGGNANDSPTCNVNPAGNTPPVNPPQGSNGGFGRGNTGINAAGGGGGATGVGGNGTGPSPSPTMGPGGAGATSSITGSPVGRAGGGAGGRYAAPGSQSAGTVSDGGGLGGPNAANGTANTGGGGGGGGHASDPGTQNGGTGGSGVVILRYKFQ